MGEGTALRVIAALAECFPARFPRRRCGCALRRQLSTAPLQRSGQQRKTWSWLCPSC